MISSELADEAIEKLKIFIIDIQSRIDDLVEKREVYFNKNYSNQIFNSWRELKGDKHFENLLTSLINVRPDNLVKEGLYGKQLNFKLTVYDDAISDFRKKIKSDNKEILNKIFKILKSIIKSLIDALGGGAAIREFIDFLEITKDE